MEKIVLYAPHRWIDLRPLRKALLDKHQRITGLCRRAEDDNTLATVRVNWGGKHPLGACLNGNPPRNKHRELTLLKEAGVPVPAFDAGGVHPIGYNVGEWLPRSLRHRAAADLLAGMANYAPIDHHAGLLVQRVAVDHEFRFHVFKTPEDRWVSIRAGLKVKARETAHPWIRTLGEGWNIDYGNACRDLLRGHKNIRETAKAAVEALQLDFGAVDIGLMPDGRPIVFEVNTAPGLANSVTAEAYARHIHARMP